MGELLLDESGQELEAPWSVEKRFRVTEVFLAVLWVRNSSKYSRNCLVTRLDLG